MARIPIVDTVIEKRGRILFVRREFEPVGKLDLPGGFVNKGESLEDASRREVLEETGLKVRLRGSLGAFDYDDRGSKTAHVFVGEITGGKLAASPEGEPEWIDPQHIDPRDLAFPQKDVRILQAYGEWKKKR
ncbi:MAG: NUDIX hydrolase [Nanoarchaeota archaeon]